MSPNYITQTKPTQSILNSHRISQTQGASSARPRRALHSSSADHHPEKKTPTDDRQKRRKNHYRHTHTRACIDEGKTEWRRVPGEGATVLRGCGGWSAGGSSAARGAEARRVGRSSRPIDKGVSPAPPRAPIPVPAPAPPRVAAAFALLSPFDPVLRVYVYLLHPMLCDCVFGKK